MAEYRNHNPEEDPVPRFEVATGKILFRDRKLLEMFHPLPKK